MASFDSVMNTLVPIIIVLVFGGIMYVKLKPGIDAVGGWIKGLFGWGKTKLTDTTSSAMSSSYELVYR